MNINDPANIDEAIEAIKEICPDVEETLTRKAEAIVLCAVKDGELIKRHDTQWIPVTERLPEFGVRALCKCRANIYEVLTWTADEWKHDPEHIYMSGFVTHWMLLPEPPKEGE